MSKTEGDTSPTIQATTSKHAGSQSIPAPFSLPPLPLHRALQTRTQRPPQPPPGTYQPRPRAHAKDGQRRPHRRPPVAPIPRQPAEGAHLEDVRPPPRDARLGRLPRRHPPHRRQAPNRHPRPRVKRHDQPVAQPRRQPQQPAVIVGVPLGGHPPRVGGRLRQQLVRRQEAAERADVHLKDAHRRVDRRPRDVRLHVAGGGDKGAPLAEDGERVHRVDERQRHAPKRRVGARTRQRQQVVGGQAVGGVRAVGVPKRGPHAAAEGRHVGRRHAARVDGG